MILNCYFSTNSVSDFPIICVHPSTKFSFAKSWLSAGKVSNPSWVNFNLVLLPSGNNSNVTNEFPACPSYRQLYCSFFPGTTSVILQKWMEQDSSLLPSKLNANPT